LFDPLLRERPIALRLNALSNSNPISYEIPVKQQLSQVERTGIEPVTSGLQNRAKAMMGGDNRARSVAACGFEEACLTRTRITL
jgi:hypothetical protein